MRREVVWNLGTLPAGSSGQLTLRVEPIEGGNSLTFDSVATIEGRHRRPDHFGDADLFDRRHAFIDRVRPARPFSGGQKRRCP